MNHRKITWLLFLPLLLLVGFFGFGKNIARASGHNVVINEIQISGKSAGDEFVELYNLSDQDIDLSTWSIQYRGGSGTKYYRKNFTSGSKIRSNDYFLIAHNSFSGSALPDMKHSTFSLSATGGTIFLVKSQNDLDKISPDKLIEDKVGYGLANEFESLPAWKPGTSQSIERKNFVDTDNNHEDFSLPGTPSPQNSTPAEPEPIPPPKIYSNKLMINEIFPKPLKDSGQEEFVELYNSSDQEEALDGWKLTDRASYSCDLSGNKIGAKDFFVVTEAEIEKLGNKCTIALNDTTGEILGLYNPQNEKPLFSVIYSGSAKENLSYNFDGQDWHWSQFLTPGVQNKFNNPPEVSKKKDNKIYVDVYADFSAKGHDADKDKLKYTWDFGDGHKSYKKETRHKFKKAGKYKVTLKVSDGSEDKIETFNIKVEKFPKSKIRILSVSPNPKGKDSDFEYITLQNKSKKKINLKDWSVATGSKNLYNHPIYEDIAIKPGKTITLTRAFSKFSLNNKNAKIELRYPDGKVASKLAYDKKKESVAEDEIYTKESGQWAWVAPKTETRLALATKPPETISPVIAKKEVPKEPEIILSSGQNFSEDENLIKNSLENFTRPQGVVLGAATFKPNFSETYRTQNKTSYFETLFILLNYTVNYLLNNVSFFFN